MKTLLKIVVWFVVAFIGLFVWKRNPGLPASDHLAHRCRPQLLCSVDHCPNGCEASRVGRAARGS